MNYFRYLFSIRKLVYFIKDIVFYVALFALGYLLGAGIIKVHAQEVDRIINFDPILNKVKESNFETDFSPYNGKYCTVNIKSELDKLEEALKNSGMNYLILTPTIYANRSGLSREAGYLIYEFSDNNLNLTTAYNTGETSMTFRKSVNPINGLGLKTDGYDCESDFNFDTLINYINENKHLPSLSDSADKTYHPFRKNSGTNNILMWPSFANNSYDVVQSQYIYSTNMVVKFTTLNSYFSGIKIGNNIYTKGSTMPSYRSLPGYGKTYYTFYDSISTVNTSQVRFKFEVPANKMFDFFLNYSVTMPTNFFEISPFLEYVTEDERLIHHTYNLPLSNRTHSLDKVIYSGTQTNVLSDVITLEFVVDLEVFRGTNNEIQIFFEAEYPYTYELLTESYYTEVDWTNNYAIMLIPKVYDLELFHTNEVYSAVYFKGKNLNTALYDSLDTSTPIKQFTGTGDPNVYHHLQYLFRHSNKNQLLFFTNPSYLSSSDKTFVKYDTRYFTHGLCKTEFECDPIINPNTNETVQIKPPTFFFDEENSDDYTFNGVVGKLKKFVNSLHETLDPISNSIQYFFDKLPSIVKEFLIVIYTSFLLFILYKILRR